MARLSITGPLSSTVGSTETYTADIMDGSTVVASNVSATWTVGTGLSNSSGSVSYLDVAVGSFIQAAYTHDGLEHVGIIHVDSNASTTPVSLGSATIFAGFTDRDATTTGTQIDLGDSITGFSGANVSGELNVTMGGTLPAELQSAPTISKFHNKYFSWTSSNPSIILVSEDETTGNAVATALRTGTATISIVAKSPYTITQTVVGQEFSVISDVGILTANPSNISYRIPYGYSPGTDTVQVSIFSAKLTGSPEEPSEAAVAVPSADLGPFTITGDPTGAIAQTTTDGNVSIVGAGTASLSVTHTASGRTVKVPIKVIQLSAFSSATSNYTSAVNELAKSSYVAMNSMSFSTATRFVDSSGLSNFSSSASVDFAAEHTTLLTYIQSSGDFKSLVTNLGWSTAFTDNRLTYLFLDGQLDRETYELFSYGPSGVSTKKFPEKLGTTAIESLSSGNRFWDEYSSRYGHTLGDLQKLGQYAQSSDLKVGAPSTVFNDRLDNIDAGVVNASTDLAGPTPESIKASFYGALTKSEGYLEEVLNSGVLDLRLAVVRASEKASQDRSNFVSKIEARIHKVRDSQ